MKFFDRNTWAVASFVVGNLVGAGFFLMPASLAVLGKNLIWSWLVGLSIALFFCFIFGRLFVLHPECENLTGYFNDFPLKQTVAILYWSGIIAGNVIVLTMISSVFNISSLNYLAICNLIAIVILVAGNYFFSSSNVQSIEGIISFFKFLLLILIPILIFLINPTKINIPKGSGSFFDIIRIGALSFWSFMGIETAGVFGKGEDARNGLFIGVFLCFLLYLTSSFLIVGMVPLEKLINCYEMPIVSLVGQSSFCYFSKYVNFLVGFTALASLYGWFAISSKIALNFAEQKIFPSSFLKKNKGGDFSSLGLMLTAILTYILLIAISTFNLREQFEFIADFVVNISLIIFGLCANLLYMESNELVDFLVSLIGMSLIYLILIMNFFSSLISLGLFGLTYYICRYFYKKK